MLRAVLLSDALPAGQVPSLGDISAVDEFDVATYDDDWAVFCKDFAETVSGRIRGLKPDIVVVRRADMAQRPSNLDGPRIRLVASGAVTAAAKILVPKTYLRTGKACADAYGRPKEQLDRDAAGFISKAAQVPAAAAALAGLVADR
jgi:hypothetical protein